MTVPPREDAEYARKKKRTARPPDSQNELAVRRSSRRTSSVASHSLWPQEHFTTRFELNRSAVRFHSTLSVPCQNPTYNLHFVLSTWMSDFFFVKRTVEEKTTSLNWGGLFHIFLFYEKDKMKKTVRHHNRMWVNPSCSRTNWTNDVCTAASWDNPFAIEKGFPGSVSLRAIEKED